MRCAHPVRTYDRIILPPSTYAQEQEKVHERWPAAVRFLTEHHINEFFEGDARAVGIVLQGGLYNTVLRALERAGVADVFGATRVPLYVLNATYPLVPEEILRFAAGKRALLVVEEGQPEFIEQALAQILSHADSDTRVIGKGPLPMAGEYTGAVVLDGVRLFLQEFAPELLAGPRTPAAEVALRPRGALAARFPRVPRGCAPAARSGRCSPP